MTLAVMARFFICIRVAYFLKNWFWVAQQFSQKEKKFPPMLTSVELPTSGEYRTGSDHEPVAFYMSALLESSRFDLLLGYFSSSAIQVLSLGFAKFLANGGQMRMVINHILSHNDKAAVIAGVQSVEADYLFSFHDFQNLRKSLDAYGRHFFECLAWLIAAKRIEIVAVKPRSDKGISHYKSGIFSDGEQDVKFQSSCNFTASGLLENLEELFVKTSNGTPGDRQAIADYREYFERIFSGEADFVEYIPFEAIEVATLDEFGGRNLHDLLVQESQLLLKKQEQFQKPAIARVLERAQIQVENYLREPRFPFPSGAREYQNEAYQNWCANGFHGIFAMATGTGKTITALNCVLEEYLKHPDKIFQAVILVPTISLVEQWEKEAQAFNFSNIIKISAKNDWEQPLSNLLTFVRFGGKKSFILICTYASFYREKFQHHFQKLPAETILIADEGHNIASAKVLEVLPSVHLTRRIGLSATPKRNYDLAGTVAMETFFRDAEPYTYSFSMERAIEEGVLCQYQYFPHLVALTAPELEEYVRISKKLMRLFDFKNGKFKESDAVEKLLLARKRVVQKAANKLTTTCEILAQHFEKKGDLKYTFIYVPEGFSPSGEEQWAENEEDLRLINQYTQAIGDISPKVTVNQFTGETKNRDLIFRGFAKGEIQVLASMKCLDEGIDIPRAELAIFCSSTGNPRQFIQRRGRVLRRHPDKHLAVVHDLVVAPDFEGVDLDAQTFNMERNGDGTGGVFCLVNQVFRLAKSDFPANGATETKAMRVP